MDRQYFHNHGVIRNNDLLRPSDKPNNRIQIRTKSCCGCDCLQCNPRYTGNNNRRNDGLSEYIRFDIQCFSYSGGDQLQLDTTNRLVNNIGRHHKFNNGKPRHNRTKRYDSCFSNEHLWNQRSK